jgi:hypothetical protein
MSIAKKKAVEMYNSLPQHIKEDTYEALLWAMEYMMQEEGEGHSFQIYGNMDATVSCSLSKPQWTADHCSKGMETGAEAIVMAVCEYVNGV